ncbi:MAG: FecR family protein [Gammaproteobacteria bacterium]
MSPRHLRLFAAFTLLALFSSAIHAAKEPTPVGTVTRIQGWAIEEPLGLETRALKAGSAVHELSKIKTGHDSRLEIEFSDGAKMQLGAWAFVEIEDYANDENRFAKTAAQFAPAKRNAMNLKVLSGTFRLLSGLIAKRDRRSVRVGTPVATLGLRGTELFGGPLQAGMPPGEIHYGFMIIDGAIDVINEHGRVTLDSPNEGTFLPMAGHKAPTPPAQWKDNEVAEAYGSLEFR